MTRYTLPTVLASLLVPTWSTIAAADTAAPGACDACVTPAPQRPAELSRRWGIGARAVSMSLDDGATTADYAGGGFTASYRINRRWEVALAFDALDAPEGPDLHSSLLSARFHLWPLRQWDVYLLAGIGGLHEVPLEGEEHHAATRGQFHAGVGVGRRWRWIGVSAELHAVAAGPAEVDDPEMTARTAPATESPMTAEDELGGGELTVAATFFF